MHIQLLGTGTPTPSLKRSSSGHRAKVARDVLLLGEDFMAVPLAGPVPGKLD